MNINILRKLLLQIEDNILKQVIQSVIEYNQ